MARNHWVRWKSTCCWSNKEWLGTTPASYISVLYLSRLMLCNESLPIYRRNTIVMHITHHCSWNCFWIIISQNNNLHFYCPSPFYAYYCYCMCLVCLITVHCHIFHWGFTAHHSTETALVKVAEGLWQTPIGSCKPGVVFTLRLFCARASSVYIILLYYYILTAMQRISSSVNEAKRRNCGNVLKT